MELERNRWWRWSRVFLSLILGVIAVTVGARIDVPMVPVPMTLQSLAVVMIGGFLGPGWGTATLMLYLAVGALGLPVFANGAMGIEPLFSAGAGYLWSFPIAALVAGLAERLTRDAERRLAWLTLGFVLTHVLILALGVWGLARTLILAEALSVGAWPFLPGAVVKSALGAFLVVSIRWRLQTPGWGR